jgi:hypothetical protein
MKLRTNLATFTLVIGAALGINAPARAQAIDPCTLYLCMAGISGVGASGGPACIPPITYWHAVAPAGLAVYDYWGFDAPASLALRTTYLSSCPGALSPPSNAAILQTILSIWGSIP